MESWQEPQDDSRSSADSAHQLFCQVCGLISAPKRPEKPQTLSRQEMERRVAMDVSIVGGIMPENPFPSLIRRLFTSSIAPPCDTRQSLESPRATYPGRVPSSCAQVASESASASRPRVCLLLMHRSQRRRWRPSWRAHCAPMNCPSMLDRRRMGRPLSRGRLRRGALAPRRQE
jgi:hypothetical protein